MATSIPKQRGGPMKARVAPSSLPLSLGYLGKRNEDEILQTPAVALSRLWPIADTEKLAPNRLVFGENSGVLAALLKDSSVRGNVQLIYIDPPFATGGVFQSRKQEDAYDDVLTGVHFIEFLRERLILLREILAEDGSIYVHLDKNMAFSIKLIMDEIFGASNFRNWITRKKCNPKNYTSRSYGNVADYILFYTRSDTYVWNRPTEPWTTERAKEYQYVDQDGRRYMKVPVHAPGVRNGETGQPWRGKLPPPGKHWQYPPWKLDEMDAQGLIYWSPSGNPRRKVYLDESAGVPVQDIWLDFRDAHNQNVRITGFPTEKNPDMIQRIVAASSNPGGLVLDCFAGSGTTLAVASQLQRRWIGIDNSIHAITTTLKRFTHGTTAMGDFITPQSNGATQATLWSHDPEKPTLPEITDFALYRDLSLNFSGISADEQIANWRSLISEQYTPARESSS